MTDDVSGLNTDLSPDFKFLTTIHSVFTGVLPASLCRLNQWQNVLLKRERFLVEVGFW